MTKISIVISAYNEEKNLPRCLESVKDLASEIIVVDNESTDNTVEIAIKYGALIFSQPNNQMLNINKNFGFAKATGDWILNLDADEQLSLELKHEIQNTISHLAIQPACADRPFNHSSINGYRISRKNIIFGKWIEHSLWWPDKQLRLFKNGKGKFPEIHVHENLKVEGNVSDLKNPMIHINYTSISQFINKMDKIYTENEAQIFIEKGKKMEWKDVIETPASDFIKNYFFLKGYKDGLHGLVLNLLQSFYTEVTLAKIWEKEGFKEKEINLDQIEMVVNKNIKEIKYWLLTEKIAETKNPLEKIVLKIKRKLLQT